MPLSSCHGNGGFARQPMSLLLPLWAISWNLSSSGSASKSIIPTQMKPRAYCHYQIIKGDKGTYLLLNCSEIVLDILESWPSREDKIMFSVNVWQWILELLFQMLAIVQLNFLMGRSKFLDSLWHVFGLFHVQFINAFYLFGDRKFQRHVDENGLLKAIRRALLQMY